MLHFQLLTSFLSCFFVCQFPSFLYFLLLISSPILFHTTFPTSFTVSFPPFQFFPLFLSLTHSFYISLCSRVFVSPFPVFSSFHYSPLFPHMSRFFSLPCPCLSVSVFQPIFFLPLTFLSWAISSVFFSSYWSLSFF